ncbi:MAG: glycosyltransferase family 4 protein [Planctomycetes bacterium]|nr:glycosyltransferase family 4 protein [Planctomycetota bacterium]
MEVKNIMLNRNIRIILISPLPPPVGGIASWTKRIIDWTADKKNIVIDTVNTAVIGKRLEKINSRRNFFEEFLRTIKILMSLKKKISLFSPDIIHINTPCGKFGLYRDFLCAKIVKRNNIKLVVHYRCNIEDQVGKSKFLNRIIIKLAQLADKNLVLNDFSKKYLEKISGRNSIFLPNFIESEAIMEDKRRISHSIKNISFVGHVQKSKGLLEIIELSKKFSNITFKLAGPVSDEVDINGLPQNIIFLGSIDKKKVSQLLLDSDLFLFPTHSEGFSNALLEAMALGLPAVATDVGANRDMLEDKGGIIVPKSDVEEMKKAIQYLEPKNIRNRMSIWEIEKVRTEYTLEKVVPKLLKIYEEMLGGINENI